MALDPFIPGGAGNTLKYTHFFDNTLALPADASLSGTGTAFYYGSWTGADSIGYTPSDLNSVLDTSTSYYRTEIIISPGSSISSPPGDVNSGTYTDATDVYSRSTSANDMPGGKGNKYTITQLKRTPAEWNAQSTPQMWMGIVGRNSWASSQIPDLCYSYQVKVPSNLADIMDRRAGFSEWFETFFIKSNSDNNLTDSRIAVAWNRDVTTRAFSWRILFDLFVKDLYGTALSSSNNLWGYSSEPGTLVAGHVYQVNLYFAPPESKTDLTGKAQALIIDQTDNTVALAVTINNVVMMGYNNHNFARVAMGGLYTGGFPPSGDITLEYGNFMMKQCPGGIINESSYDIKDVISMAPFYLPMNGTLEVDVPGTSIVPVFTRASTTSFISADGNTVTLPVNAVRMRGYRPVINRVTNSYTISTSFAATRASWTSGQTDPDGGTTAYKLTEDGTASNTHLAQFSSGTQDAGDYLCFVCAKAAERRYVAVRVYVNTTAVYATAVFDLQTGTQTSTSGSPDAYGIADIGNGWYQIYVRRSHASGTVGFAIAPSNSATPTFSASLPSYSGDGVSGVYIWHPMLQNVTTQTDKTPGEYVSTGELSAPWHGAGVDGVKYFSTYEDGTPIPEANLIGAEINPATESLSYVAGYDTARGTMMAVVTKDDWSTGNGAVIGSSTGGLQTTSSAGGVTALDGTNTATGPSITPSGKMVIGLRWSGGKMQVFSNGQFGAETNYDGNFNLTNFVLMAGCTGVLGKTMFYARYLSDEEVLYAYSELIR